MKNLLLAVALTIACVFAFGVSLPAQGAELKVYSDGPLQPALRQLTAEFRAATGHELSLVYGTAPALKAKIEAGEKPDVLISLASEVHEMANAGRVAASQQDVARIKLGLAVP